MTRILCPRASGVLAALGLVVSERRRDAQRSVLLGGGALTAEALREEIAALAERAGAGELRVRADLRYRGQAFELTVDADQEPDPDDLRERFAAAHERAYGYRDDDGDIELVTLRVTATEPGPDVDAAAAGAAGAGAETSARTAWFDGEEHEAEVIAGEPAPGAEVTGPAICELPEATLAVPPGWAGRVEDSGHDPAGASRVTVDAVTLRVVSGALRAACEEMGAVLIRAAHSANIKERRDASCALFDPGGRDGDAGGAHPRPPRRDAGRRRGGRRRGPRARRVLGPQRPVPRRHPPPRHHRHHAGLRRRRHAARLRLQPRPPRRRRGPDARQHARRLDHARGRGRGDRAAPARRGRDRGARRPDAPAVPAPRRPARPARRQPHRRRAAARAARPRRPAGRDGRDDRLRRAADARLPGGARRRRAQRGRRARGARG